MYAWEKPFEVVVKAARAFEMGALRKSMFVRSMFLGFMMYTERTILFVTTLTMVLTGTMVTATTVSVNIIYYSRCVYQKIITHNGTVRAFYQLPILMGIDRVVT